MSDETNNPQDDESVDPLTWELTRDERKETEQPTAPKARQVYTYRPASTTDKVGSASAVASVLGTLLGRGAGHAMPVVVKIVLLGVVLTIVGMAVMLLSQRFGAANEVRKELDAMLVEYREPVRHAAGRLAAEGDVRARFDTVDWLIDPVIESLPTSVRFTVYREEDKLEKAFGTGTHAEGTIYFDRREFQIRLKHEGATVAADVVKLPPKEEPDAEK